MFGQMGVLAVGKVPGRITAGIATMACLAALFTGCAAAPSPDAEPDPVCASTATPGWTTDPRLVSDNDVRGFVYQFFGWFDRNADPCLSITGLRPHSPRARLD